MTKSCNIFNVMLSFFKRNLIIFQATPPVVAVRADQRRAGTSQLQGDGVQYRATLRHAAFRDPKHRLLPMENEQRTRLYHVPSLLRLCCCQLRP